MDFELTTENVSFGQSDGDFDDGSFMEYWNYCELEVMMHFDENQHQELSQADVELKIAIGLLKKNLGVSEMDIKNAFPEKFI